LVVGTGIIIYSLSVLQKNLTELEALTKTMKQIIDNKSIVMEDEKLSIGVVDCGTF
jgi:hypothetical protein